MTQSDSEYEKRLWELELLDQMQREIWEEDMAKKAAERVPKKYGPQTYNKKTARKKIAPRKPDSIYPPWPKAE